LPSKIGVGDVLIVDILSGFCMDATSSPETPVLTNPTPASTIFKPRRGGSILNADQKGGDKMKNETYADQAKWIARWTILSGNKPHKCCTCKKKITGNALETPNDEWSCTPCWLTRTKEMLLARGCEI
jgi:hypothetical protein